MLIDIVLNVDQFSKLVLHCRILVAKFGLETFLHDGSCLLVESNFILFL